MSLTHYLLTSLSHPRIKAGLWWITVSPVSGIVWHIVGPHDIFLKWVNDVIIYTDPLRPIVLELSYNNNCYEGGNLPG